MMIVRVVARIPQLTKLQSSQFSMLNDYLNQKQVNKQEKAFKQEMEYLANKPNFTIMDYKQRI